MTFNVIYYFAKLCKETIFRKITDSPLYSTIILVLLINNNILYSFLTRARFLCGCCNVPKTQKCQNITPSNVSFAEREESKFDCLL